MTTEKTTITVEATVQAPVDKVWELWTSPRHIIEWNQASADWCTTRAENDLVKGGRFSSRMEARDGSAGFDFSGVYDEVKPQEFIAYTIGDGRKVQVSFRETDGTTHIVETFEAEQTHSLQMQRDGWQAILDSFKRYAERG